VPALAYAAIAAGADGLMIEAHPKPSESLSDAAQTIGFQTLAQIIDKGRSISQVFGKTLGRI
jgi:3-deoxy-7-phosphoheptulonate synthase